MFKLKVILYVQICHFREYRMCLLSQVRTMFDQEVTTVQLNVIGFSGFGAFVLVPP